MASDYYDHMAAGLQSIVRNLSLIVANEETLAYHPRLLHHIVSLLPCWKTEVSQRPSVSLTDSMHPPPSCL